MYMKKIIILISLLLLCGCNKDITLSENTFEYFSKVDVKNIVNNIKCESKLLDTSFIGNHEETIKCQNKNYKIKYNVVDTTAPIIWVSNSITRDIGYENDIANEISCMDNADRTPNCYIEGDYDVNTLGTYNLKYIAKDQSGNKASKDFKLIIKEKSKSTGSYTNGVLTNYLEFSDVYQKHKTDDTLIGIDVSKYQGKIDWQKVKDAGVEFAIIRLGYRYYYDEPLNIDPYYLENIKGATENGIKVGIYFYSYAKSIEDAKEEANFVLDNIKGYNIDLPIAFDWENFKYFNAAQINLFDLREISNTYLDILNSAGYETVHYGSKSYLEYIWLPVKHDIWLAHYTEKTSYKGPYVMWQLASNGKVDGINNYVDIDVYYKK